MEFGILKNEITNKLPNDNSELNWIINMVGDVLFGDTWEELKDTLLNKGVISKSDIGEYLLKQILSNKNNLTKSEVNELFNQLFTESLKKKNNNN